MKILRFEAAEYLGTRESQIEYIAAARETGDPEFVRDAYVIVERARELARLAEQRRR
jgi:DNA-binding phage protein